LKRRVSGEQAAGPSRPRLTLPRERVIFISVKYEPLLHIVLHQPEIPYNTGSVGRTCVAAGAKLWLVRPLGFRVDDYYLRRAGLDYWQHLEWEVVDDWAALVERLAAESTSPFYYFTKTATRSYTTAQYQPGDVLVFGSESQGLPSALLESNQERALRIEIRPEARSLNLSNSVAIAVFEARRQWEAAADSEQ
jgi:tRNA (cytidine/uridine-2'-O-)-methyltransferase